MTASTTREPDHNRNVNSLYVGVYPLGWYPLVRSRELGAREHRALDVLGRQLVVFRTEAGRASAIDRFCPHMGASLARGQVRGERIVCPFHRWEFDVRGKCQHIPYVATDKIPRAAVVPAMATVERYGFVWGYHGRDVAFDLPALPEYDQPGFTIRSKTFHLDMHPLLALENGTDFQHFKYIHKVDFDEVDVDVVRDEPHDFEIVVRQHLATRQFGAHEIRTGIHYVGASVIFGRLELGKRLVARFIAAPVPVAPKKTAFHLTVIAKNLPIWAAPFSRVYTKFVTEQIFHGATDDYDTVWRDMNTDARGVLVADDALQQRFRKYYRNHLPKLAMVEPAASDPRLS